MLIPHMAKKSESTAETTETPVVFDPVKLQTFSFPNIGDGISIQAENEVEARKIAEKIKQSLAT